MGVQRSGNGQSVPGSSIIMDNPRKYGKAPYSIVLLHGGPGAAGEMAPLALELFPFFGILEPFQTQTSIDRQIQELRNILADHADCPVTLVGFSWGAWLAYLFTAHHPQWVKKLVLIGCPPFEEKYAKDIMKNRYERLTPDDGSEVEDMFRRFDFLVENNDNAAFAKIGKIIEKADAFAPVEDISTIIDYRIDIFYPVWQEAAMLRRQGKILEIGYQILCPTLAIHGDYDVHPASGVQTPLSTVMPNFRFVLLENCGHKPWIEQHACQTFYRILFDALTSTR